MLLSNPKRHAVISGFALIITLIMVTLAAILVIGLLSSASIDRTTSSAYNDRYQAEIAAQNGLEAAKKLLIASPAVATSVTADDAFLVLRADGTQGPNSSGNRDAYYFLARAQAGATNKVDCYPLFSGGTPSQLNIDHINVPAIQQPVAPSAAYASNPAQDTARATPKKYPVLFPFQQPVFTQWQEIHDPNDTATSAPYTLPYQRYTFWMEDMSGYLDASVVGNGGGGAPHQRTNGTNSNEIALFTIFNSAIADDSGSTLANTLVDNRGLLFTTPTLKQVAPPPSGQIDVTQQNLAVRFGVDAGGEQNLIPFGFHYKDEGKVRTNLNTIIQDATTSNDNKVTALAKVVADNLPQFAASRRGGFPAGEDYVKTCAANMIGYATMDAVVGPQYRGIGRYPFVVEFYEKFKWEKEGSETTNFYLSNNTWWANVRAVGYIELWNMSNRAIDSGTFQFTDINRFYAYVGGTSDQNKFEDSFGKGSITFTAATALQPNEFRVVKIYEHLYKFNTGLTVRPTGSAAAIYLGSEAGPKIDPTDCGYLVEWNNNQVDRAGFGALDGVRGDGTDKFPGLNYSGVERSYANLTTPNSAPDPEWRGTLPGLRYDSLSETLFNLGDPRSSYYMTKVQAHAAYAQTSSTSYGQSAWWGRMYQDGLVNHSNWKAAQTTVAAWPDGGHSSTKGLTPPNTATDPTALTPLPAAEPSKAPTYFAGGGKYISITELGRVYDPIRWKPSGFPPSSSADFAQKWQDSWKSTMTADPNYGCASTFRIGSPEFKNFDNDDARAARLLDLFSSADRFQTRGVINVNAASRDVLRALAAGIQINSDNVDAGMLPVTVNGPLNDPAAAIQADKFADAVIASRPFLSVSQFSGIAVTPANHSTNFFGNATQWSSGGPTEWSDSAREDYFSRIFNLVTVRSRNFRVFLTGQSLDKNGRPLSTVHRVYQIYLRPTRNPIGNITAQLTETTYETNL